MPQMQMKSTQKVSSNSSQNKETLRNQIGQVKIEKPSKQEIKSKIILKKI